LTLPVIFDRTIKPYILILALIFAASFLAGTLAPAPLRKGATETFRYFADSFQGLSGGTLFFYILSHNLLASILVLFSGVLIGIIPVLAIGSNGFILGVLYRQVAEMLGYSQAALKVLPHGVFEIPALLIAASYGLWLGVMVVWRMRGKESTPLRFHIGNACRQYLAVVFPLLIVAAGIETALILGLQ
jgi:stage II sporulation protein M